jgi:hypothetical protein
MRFEEMDGLLDASRSVKLKDESEEAANFN